MAAAAIPLVLAATPLLRPVITGLVHGVEALFGHKTGPTKFDIVLASITKIAADLSAAGKIPGVLDQTTLATLIESIVQELKARNLLTPEASAAVMAGGNAGGAQTLTLTGTFKAA